MTTSKPNVFEYKNNYGKVLIIRTTSSANQNLWTLFLVMHNFLPLAEIQEVEEEAAEKLGTPQFRKIGEDYTIGWGYLKYDEKEQPPGEMLADKDFLIGLLETF